MKKIKINCCSNIFYHIDCHLFPLNQYEKIEWKFHSKKCRFFLLISLFLFYIYFLFFAYINSKCDQPSSLMICIITNVDKT